MTMDESTLLTGRFEENRKHLHSVAYRMLGSLSEADDAVQEAWLRLNRSDASAIENLGGWLTTVVARVCLDMLRTRRSRAENPVGARVPDPIISSRDGVYPARVPSITDTHGVDPEHAAILSDSVSLALLVVLETLAPSERLAFVLHDMFNVPFDEIAPLVGKTPAAARQMTSRARRRVRGVRTPADADLGAQQEVVTAFLAAARGGDFDALLRLLDPDVVVHGDLGATSSVVRGAASAAKGAIAGGQLTAAARLVLVNGAPGYVAFNQAGEPRAVVAFTVRSGKITEIHVLADPERLRQLGLANESTRSETPKSD
jgi:RNA polymerase sigma factor (sigma-70 family)